MCALAKKVTFVPVVVVVDPNNSAVEAVLNVTVEVS